MADHVSTARARFLRGSPQKFHLVADQIRGCQVPEALGVLQLSKKRASKSLETLLRSAVANAENLKPEVDVDGILGAKTRDAVQKEQERLGMPADAWPTRELLNKL